MQTFIKAKRSSSWSTGDRNLPLMTQLFDLYFILLARIFVFHTKYSLLLLNKSPRSIMDFALTLSNTQNFVLASVASERPKQTKQLRASTQTKTISTKPCEWRTVSTRRFCLMVLLCVFRCKHLSELQFLPLKNDHLECNMSGFPSLVHLDSATVAEISCSFSMVHW